MANPLLTAIFALLAAPSVMQGVNNSYPPFAAGLARKGYKDRPDLIPTPEALVGMRLKELMNDEKFLSTMREAGYDAETARGYLANARNYLSVFDYVTLWRRGEISDAGLSSLLGELGFSESGIEHAKQATIYYPTPQDLIRFAVRDVYSPKTVELYGMDQDFPPEFAKEAAKVGLQPEQQIQYWREHWQLPSPTQVYEMLHRRIITEDEVKDFLKSADYMPYWRQKLIDISYNPLTRVDVMRMYRFGTLNAEEVYEAFRDGGYNDKNASRLTAWVVDSADKAEDETPKTTTIASYKAGLITREQAVSQLVDSGYTQDMANVTIDTADAQIKQELIDLQADAIIDQYVRGGIDLNAVRVELTKLGVPSRMMDLTIQRELAQARKRAKVASKSDLDTWWVLGFLSDSRYTERLQALGYSQVDSKIYLSEMKVKQIQGAEKKSPWAQTMRDFVDGKYSITTFESMLAPLKLDPEVVADLVEIAVIVKG